MPIRRPSRRAIVLLLAVSAGVAGGLWFVQRWRDCAVRYDEAGNPLPVVALTRRHVWYAESPFPWSRGPSQRALDAFSGAYRADVASKRRPDMLEYAIARAEDLGGMGASLKWALAVVDQDRLPLWKDYSYDWVPCYIELVRFEGTQHWAVRVAWGDVREGDISERLGHLADYLITASPPHRIVSRQSCE